MPGRIQAEGGKEDKEDEEVVWQVENEVMTVIVAKEQR